MEAAAVKNDTYGPWNPGLQSQIPRELQPLVTLYRTENSKVGVTEAQELADFCGLPQTELVAFRIERLIVHELLIQITADMHIPDGPNYEDFGINLRTMAETIMENHIRPQLKSLRGEFDQLVDETTTIIAGEVSERLFPGKPAPKPPKSKPSLLHRLLGRAPTDVAGTKTVSDEPGEIPALADWRARSNSASDDIEASCVGALVKVVSSIVRHRGRLMGDADVIAKIASNLVLNTIGSTEIGRAIKPIVEGAAKIEGYRYLPVQSSPVVMNVKGASAAGKSTIRPQQMRLAEKLEIPWEDFAVISPDYWRKFLLDYSALGDNYKYAAMLTGQELEIIDRKFDRYMAAKAARKQIPHLLIDRFRFDSFVAEADSKLLTRFGDRVFMFFVITPPKDTVERAWARGLKTGRYKPVDDLLYHNIEAFTGIPELFFSWVKSTGKEIHFEFLDNDVPPGDRPRTVAFGRNNEMTILDIEMLINIERYKSISIDAKSPDEIFAGSDLGAGRNTGFLRRCAEKIETINLADQFTGHVFARMKHGRWIWRDQKHIDALAAESEIHAGLSSMDNVPVSDPDPNLEPLSLANEKTFTLGSWLTTPEAPYK